MRKKIASLALQSIDAIGNITSYPQISITIMVQSMICMHASVISRPLKQGLVSFVNLCS